MNTLEYPVMLDSSTEDPLPLVYDGPLASCGLSIEQLRAEVPTLSWVEDSTASAEELIRRVAAREIDYTIADSHLFAVLRHFYPDLRVAFSLGGENQVAWALPRGEDSLRESIAAYFAEIEATGELDKIPRNGSPVHRAARLLDRPPRL